MNTRAIAAGAVIRVRPVGVMLMHDEAGPDEKIIAVPATRLTKRYEDVRTFADLPEITRARIQHFFEHYKDLEPNKWVKVSGWADAVRARAMIEAARHRAAKPDVA